MISFEQLLLYVIEAEGVTIATLIAAWLGIIISREMKQ